MLRPYPGFVGPSATEPSKLACNDRTVNWFPSKVESGTGPAAYVLYPAPGFSAFCTLPTSPGRGFFSMNGGTFAIGGSALYTAPTTAGGSPILRAQGLNNPDNGIAQMVTNGDAGHQLLINSGTTNYALDLLAPTSLTTVLDPPAPALAAMFASGGGNIPAGYFNYAVTFVTAAGETTAGQQTVLFNPGSGSPFGGTAAVQSLALGPSTGSAAVTARKIYRTATQASISAAQTAQLKLLTTIADNTTISFTDTLADASLGANAPTTNTATITILALTTLPYPANQIAFLDGYGLALDANRSELRWSGLEDFTVWDGADVLQRNDSPDKWIAMAVVRREIWLFGSISTSVYYNGDGDPPFVPNQSVSIARGIKAPSSLALLGGSPLWLADDLTVRMGTGYTPQRVSTHAVEFALAGYSTVTDAEAFVYEEQGHQFYVLNLPTGQASWVFDVTSGLWSERGPWNGLDFRVLDARLAVNAQSMNLVLSRSSGAIHQMSQAFAVDTDGVTGLRRVRRAPHVNEALKRIRYTHLRMLLDVGFGLSTGQGSDPQMMLRWSNDGGQSFGGEYLMPTGAVGAYGTLVEQWMLGQGRDRVFKFSVSDPIVAWRLVDAFLDFSVGAS